MAHAAEELNHLGGHRHAEGCELLHRRQPGRTPGGQADHVPTRQGGLQVGRRRRGQGSANLRLPLTGVDDDALGQSVALLHGLFQHRVGPLRRRDNGAYNTLGNRALEQAGHARLRDMELGGDIGLPHPQLVVHPGDTHHEAQLGSISASRHQDRSFHGWSPATGSVLMLGGTAASDDGQGSAPRYSRLPPERQAWPRATARPPPAQRPRGRASGLPRPRRRRPGPACPGSGRPWSPAPGPGCPRRTGRCSPSGPAGQSQ
ncbi:MAG: hypothetical protein Q605_AUC00962G0002 [Actinomyces urogenitalis DORA_12]|uniref:Uncharacterized protein n=1 Tax=Actinomyces urogenitalis DORA_12 TaxID=1403939 RepID=W1VF25_9ACTO|nr:MAG: hypothetical protein Q605_AUC00962G0002 [Actinomyces urogenitalis DORA_12]